MSGREPAVNPLALRKQLLIAESEINRAQLVQDGEILLNGIRAVTTKARSVGSMASVAALLVAGLVAVRRKRADSVTAKVSWLQTLLKGAKVIAPLWFAFRRARKENSESEESSNRFD